MSRTKRHARAMAADPALRRLVTITVSRALDTVRDRTKSGHNRQVIAQAFQYIQDARHSKPDEMGYVPPQLLKGSIRSMLKVARQFRQNLKPLP